MNKKMVERKSRKERKRKKRNNGIKHLSSDFENWFISCSFIDKFQYFTDLGPKKKSWIRRKKTKEKLKTKRETKNKDIFLSKPKEIKKGKKDERRKVPKKKEAMVFVLRSISSLSFFLFFFSPLSLLLHSLRLSYFFSIFLPFPFSFYFPFSFSPKLPFPNTKFK